MLLLKVLWIRFGAFGDVLQATARARLFKRKFPESHLTMLTRPEYSGIMSAQDCYDDLILWDSKREPFGLFKTVYDVRKRKFDMLVSVHNAGAAALVSLLSGIPKKYGYSRTLQFCYHHNVWDFFADEGIERDLRDVPMIFSTADSLRRAEELLSILPEKKIFCIIGASKPQKIWPIDYWVRLCRAIAQKGYGIVINGHGEEERVNAIRIVDEIRSSNILNLVDKLNFLDMAAVVAKCCAAIGPDTGPLHLAALAGTPTLGLFGCTPSRKIGFTMPWFNEALCACPDVGCFNYKCPKGEDCMKSLTPEEVLYFFERMVSNRVLD